MHDVTFIEGIYEQVFEDEYIIEMVQKVKDILTNKQHGIVNKSLVPVPGTSAKITKKLKLNKKPKPPGKEIMKTEMT